MIILFFNLYFVWVGCDNVQYGKNNQSSYVMNVQQNIYSCWNKESSEIEINNDFPFVYNEDIEKQINYYTGNAKPYFEKLLGKANNYKGMITSELQKENIAESFYLLPLIESGYISTAVSSEKASGIWQFIPYTGSYMGLKLNIFVDERMNDEKATYYAVKFLKQLHNNYDDLYFSLAAYNCGEGCVNRRLKFDESKSFWELKKLFPLQTQNYLDKFMAIYILSKNKFDYNINPKEEKQEETFSFILENPVPLNLIAKTAGISIEKIKELNPELLTLITPPFTENYKIRLPLSIKDNFIINYEIIENEIKEGFVYYEFKQGDKLKTIADFYNISTKNILSANNIKNEKKIKIGEKLIIPIDSKSISENILSKQPKKKKLVHTAKKGESYFSIAQRYNININDLKEWNPDINIKMLSIGQKIVLYTPSGKVKKSETKQSDSTFEDNRIILVNYTLKKGDNLYTLSKKYKIPLNELKKSNQMFANSKILPGKQLKFYVSQNIFEKHKDKLEKERIQ